MVLRVCTFNTFFMTAVPVKVCDSGNAARKEPLYAFFPAINVHWKQGDEVADDCHADGSDDDVRP